MPTATASREMVFYNGFRAGEDIVGPSTTAAATRRATGGHIGRDAARHREHGASLRAGPRGDDRPARPLRPAAQIAVGYDELMTVMEEDKVVVEPGDLVCLRTGFAEALLEMDRQARRVGARHLRGARRPRRAAAAVDHRLRASWRSSPTTMRSRRPSRPRASTPTAARRCRCTSTACSSSASIWARSGTCASLPTGCARTGAPLPADRPAAAAAGRGRLARDPGRDGLNLDAARATNGGAAPGRRGIRMAERSLSG